MSKLNQQQIEAEIEAFEHRMNASEDIKFMTEFSNTDINYQENELTVEEPKVKQVIKVKVYEKPAIGSLF